MVFVCCWFWLLLGGRGRRRREEADEDVALLFDVLRGGPQRRGLPRGGLPAAVAAFFHFHFELKIRGKIIEKFMNFFLICPIRKLKKNSE
jgi:hypothetical protein